MSLMFIIVGIVLASITGYVTGVVHYTSQFHNQKVPFIISYQLEGNHVIEEIIITLNFRGLLKVDNNEFIRSVVSGITKQPHNDIKIVSVVARGLNE